jgi:hypothetical protein
MQISHKKINFFLQTSENYVNVTDDLLFLKGGFAARIIHSPRSGFSRPQDYAYQPLLQTAQIWMFRRKRALWSALY